MTDRRRTIRSPVTLDGVGLHLGEHCRLTFRPAPSGAGVRFRRIDLPDAPEIPARVEHAVLAERRTQLGEGQRSLHTVEHVLAAVGGSVIDDLTIEMDAQEPPILDGSAKPYVDALATAGIAEQDGAVQYLDVVRPVRVTEGEASYEVLPALQLSLRVEIDFPHPLIGRQCGEYTVTPECFAEELAPARTFGFLHEIEMLRGMGLIRGASTRNALVLDEEGVVDSVLRWPDEFVRHKAMDCVGDLALAGARVAARVVAHKPSHRGTVLLVRAMLASVERRQACSA
jgi:UDP-3-O-acyl N-acetylglucosamine deacetylase